MSKARGTAADTPLMLCVAICNVEPAPAVGRLPAVAGVIGPGGRGDRVV